MIYDLFQYELNILSKKYIIIVKEINKAYKISYFFVVLHKYLHFLLIKFLSVYRVFYQDCINCTEF